MIAISAVALLYLWQFAKEIGPAWPKKDAFRPRYLWGHPDPRGRNMWDFVPLFKELGMIVGIVTVVTAAWWWVYTGHYLKYDPQVVGGSHYISDPEVYTGLAFGVLLVIVHYLCAPKEGMSVDERFELSIRYFFRGFLTVFVLWGHFIVLWIMIGVFLSLMYLGIKSEHHEAKREFEDRKRFHERAEWLRELSTREPYSEYLDRLEREKRDKRNARRRELYAQKKAAKAAPAQAEHANEL